MSENNTAANISVPFNARTKRPRPLVRMVTRDSQDLNWAAESIEQFVVVNGENIRSGESFAIVRPNHERWPLGHVSDHYKPTDHVALDARIMSECAEIIAPNGVVISGHGYNIAYGYVLRHVKASKVGTHDVSTKLIIAHDHTGKCKSRAAMCLYLDGKAIGAIITSEAMHVAAQPGIWQSNIDAMIEQAVLAQDAVLEMLQAAEVRILTEEDRKFLKKQGMRCPEGVVTLLDALIEHHKGRNEKVTWGVWSRRLYNDGIYTALKLLPSEIKENLEENLKFRSLPCIPRVTAA